jgi:ABC-2 type transport system permease protein
MSKSRNFFGHNFGAVVKFETTRAMKKPSFWALIVAMPLIMVVAGLIGFWGSQGATPTADLNKQEFSVAITDESKIVAPQLLSQIGAREITSKTEGIKEVKSGQINAYIYIPKDLSKNKVETYGVKTENLFDNSRYSALATTLLTASASQATSANAATILSGKVQTEDKNFAHGEEVNPFIDALLPALFLVLFFVIFVAFGNNMLVMTVEEKENRVMEMLLTTVRARTLIIGKLVAMWLLILAQMVAILALLLVAYLAMREMLNLPDLFAIFADMSINWAQVGWGVLFFIASLAFVSAATAALGGLFQTAKEASQWFVVIVLPLVIPFYVVGTILTNPTAPVITFLTLFPLTSPVMLLGRNALGNLETWQAIVGVAILLIATAALIAFAVRTFQKSAVSGGNPGFLKKYLLKRGRA